jgi:exonuclease VII small subunit
MTRQEKEQAAAYGRAFDELYKYVNRLEKQIINMQEAYNELLLTVSRYDGGDLV